MLTLGGRRIALLERRHGDELATLVHQLGGVPISAPAMDEVACHDDFNTFIDDLIGRRFSLAIFSSGAGLSALLIEAERRGCLADALEALRQLSIVSRGAKPQAVLKHHGLRAQVTTASPHTTGELLRALACIDVAARGVVLVHHGERNLAVADALRRRGARLLEVCPYEWMLPDDLEPMTRVVGDAIAHRLDVVLFTNQVQCRHLFQIAAGMNQAEGLVLSLNRHVVVGAVGPVCARALNHVGVTTDVIPSSSSMSALINAVAEYFETHEAASAVGRA
jgi:uroporphyrinogen-III synthase